MIMPVGQALLLPAHPGFIWGTLAGAFFLNVLLHVSGGGTSAWAPDIMAVTLVFWAVHQPLRVSVGAAFAIGLLADVHHGSLLGQHALAYTVMAYLAVFIHRRLLWFNLRTQTLHVLPLFAVAHLVQWLVRAIAGDGWGHWSLLLAPALEALLWPLATILLLAPQRRAHDPDADRPI